MASENYCSKCGHRILPNEPYCIGCGAKTRYNPTNDVNVFEPPIHNIGFFNFDIDFSPHIESKRKDFKYDICSCGYLNNVNNEFCYMCGAKRSASRFSRIFKGKSKPKFSMDNILCECGAINSKENVFCEMCGRQLREEIIPHDDNYSNFNLEFKDPIFCFCGEENERFSQFCKNCGLPLANYGHMGDISILCTCSKINDVTSDFCIECGTNLKKESSVITCVCGEKNPTYSKFCQSCDRPLNPQRIIKTKIICSCGEILSWDSEYCHNCGKNIKTSIYRKNSVNDTVRTIKKCIQVVIMKTCDVCGTLNLKENNYCTHCGSKFVIEHICPYCGYINQNYATQCIKCEKQINPLTIEDFDILVSEYNENLLLNAEITDGEYNEILYNLFKRANIVGFHGDTTKNKILNLASVFTECKPKSRGYERGFIFLDNCIYYDDRLADSVQIATIIHELAHYFLNTIIENVLCHILNVKSSPTLQSFIWYFLTLPELKIMNEYCAHTVEGRFIPHGYQNYGSFNVLVEDTGIDQESLEGMMALGNSFANEIIVYLEKYIDEGLRQDIKLQYNKDLTDPNYDSIFMETDNCFDLSVKNRILINVLYDVLKEVSNPDVQKELETIREGIV